MTSVCDYHMWLPHVIFRARLYVITICDYHMWFFCMWLAYVIITCDYSPIITCGPHMWTWFEVLSQDMSKLHLIILKSHVGITCEDHMRVCLILSHVIITCDHHMWLLPYYHMWSSHENIMTVCDYHMWVVYVIITCDTPSKSHRHITWDVSRRCENDFT